MNSSPRTDPVLVITSLAGLATAAFGVVAVVRPSALTSESEPGRFYARMYAARAIPLGLAVAVRAGLIARGAPSDSGDVALLAVAGAAQVGDAAIGIASRQPGQVVAPLVTAFLHAWGARRASRRRLT